MITRLHTTLIVLAFPGLALLLIGAGLVIAWPALNNALRGHTTAAQVVAIIQRYDGTARVVCDQVREMDVLRRDGALVHAVWRTGVVECSTSDEDMIAFLRDSAVADATTLQRLVRHSQTDRSAGAVVAIACRETANIIGPCTGVIQKLYTDKLRVTAVRTSAGVWSNMTCVTTDVVAGDVVSNAARAFAASAREPRNFIMAGGSYHDEFQPVLVFTVDGVCHAALSDVARRYMPPVGYGMYERARIVYVPGRDDIVYVQPAFAGGRHASMLLRMSNAIETAGAVWLPPLLLIITGLVVLLASGMFVSLDILPSRRMPADQE